MSEACHRCLIASDFNADNLAGYLSQDPGSPSVQASAAPYGQVMQTLISGGRCGESRFESAVVWTRPEAVIEPFNRLMENQQVEVEDLLTHVDSYADLLVGFNEKVPLLLVPAWALPPHRRGYGILDLRPGLGVAQALMRMNLRLCDRLQGQAGIFVLNTQRWIGLAGKHAFNTKLWYSGKIAFGNEVFKQAVEDIKAAVRARAGLSRKLIILDLDDTLWGGIVGEVGWESLVLGGHDATGEALVDFQKSLKALARRGVLLAIVSKNEEETALEAIRSHPAMVLRLDDFAGWKINWGDKAANIQALVAELNLGLQSAVFIDDSPQERSRVRQALPEVLVPQWPADKLAYDQALHRLSCFDTASVTSEDRQRAGMYASERQRARLKESLPSIQQWLKTLEIRVDVEALADANLERAAQLFNKTNQMNLRTRRLAPEELQEWSRQEGHRLWTFRASDKFGDSGLVGVASLVADGRGAEAADLLMSCRAMGRGIEECMLHVLVEEARRLKCNEVRLELLPTAKNKPCLRFLQRSGLQCIKDRLFAWDCRKAYEPPSHISLHR